jgi:hypothetical protein
MARGRGFRRPIVHTFKLRSRLTANRLADDACVRHQRAIAAGVAYDFAGHSLRRGLITNAAKKKKIRIDSIKRAAGQRSNGVVLD